MGLGWVGGGKSCCAGSVREWRVHCQGTEPAAKYVRQLANLYQIRGRGHRLSNIFPNWENFCSNRDKWNYICLFGCLTSLIQEIYSYSVGKSHTFAKSKSRRYRWVTIWWWGVRVRAGNIYFKPKPGLSVSLPFLGFLRRFRRCRDYLCGALSESPRSSQHLSPFT